MHKYQQWFSQDHALNEQDMNNKYKPTAYALRVNTIKAQGSPIFIETSSQTTSTNLINHQECNSRMQITKNKEPLP